MKHRTYRLALLTALLFLAGVIGLVRFSLLSKTVPVAQAQGGEECEAILCAQSDQDEYLNCNKDKQSCWESKIKESQNAAVSLSSTISILNGQINIQQLQIDQTLAEINKLEREITDLTNRISGLNLSLDRLSTVFIERVQAQYKRQHLSPLQILLKSSSISQTMSQFKYLHQAQEQTTTAMHQAETQKQTYDEQKLLKEAKQAEIEKKRKTLEQQRAGLTKQRSEQQFLLQETKNNEAEYRRELEKTMAELGAIQSIIAGQGAESKVGDINQGDRIASIIVGSSTCSTGSHLHFEVVKDGMHRDPAGYLKNVSVQWSNSPDGAFGLGGDWEWPVDNPAKINQGYGMTYYARVKRSYGGEPHTGIDMISKDSGNYAIKAVKAGTLYRGSIKCGGGQLRYVKVDHKDDAYTTYYLHVNY
jgi:peptidoglycan hydrolase CwlO-like protein